MSHPGQRPVDEPGSANRREETVGGEHGRMRLNKRPPSNRRMLDGDKYLTAVPDVPASIGVPELRFPMDHNDAWGDCVIAGVDHALQTQAVAYGVARVNWTDAEQLAYYRTQNPDFDPNGSPDDNGPGSSADGGMSVADFLTYLVKQGVILAFAKVSHDPTTLRAAIYVGLAVVTGEVMCAQQMQTSQPWDAVGGTEEGGHCTCSVAFPDTNTVAVTWGTTVEMTDRFIERQMDEAYLVLPTFYSARQRAGFPLATLAADWEDLTGRAFPEPVGPNPGPTPDVTVGDVSAAAFARLQHLAAEHGLADAGAYLTWLYDKASRGEELDAEERKLVDEADLDLTGDRAVQ